MLKTTAKDKKKRGDCPPLNLLSDENRPCSLDRIQQVPREPVACRLQILRHISNGALVNEPPSLIDNNGIVRLKVGIENGEHCYSFLNVVGLIPHAFTLAEFPTIATRIFVSIIPTQLSKLMLNYSYCAYTCCILWLSVCRCEPFLAILRRVNRPYGVLVSRRFSKGLERLSWLRLTTYLLRRCIN